jgi:hypothetical protein
MLEALDKLETEIAQARNPSSSKPNSSTRLREELARKSTEFQDKLKVKKKKKKKKKHRRKHSSSGSGSSSGSTEEDLGGGRGAIRGDVMDVAQRTPGHLLQNCLTKMRRYLTTHQGSSSADDGMQPVVTAYLTSVLVPAAGKDLSLRNLGELRHFAEALDLMLSGNTLGAADVFAQCFRSVETSHFDGNWQRARHLEIVGDS